MLPKGVIKHLKQAARHRDQQAMQMLSNWGICPKCFVSKVRHRWEVIADGREQIRAECRRCGRFLKWAPQTIKNRALADRAAYNE